METLKQVLVGFSAAAIFIGALTQLYPSGSMKKTVKYAFSLLFLCICVTLFATALRLDIRVDLPDTASVSADITAAANAQAEYLCETLLKENEIDYKKVIVNTNIDENGGIYINSITVYTDCDSGKVREIFEKMVDGKRVTIVYA